MDLKEFVRVTLTQVTEGVKEAQEAVRAQGGFVNPTVHTSQKDESHFAGLHDGQNVFLVDFDVAVTVNEGTGTNAEAKLKVASLFALGTSGKSSENQEYSSRIKFKVPLALPVDPEAKRLMEQRYREREATAKTALQKNYDPYERI